MVEGENKNKKIDNLWTCLDIHIHNEKGNAGSGYSLHVLMQLIPVKTDFHDLHSDNLQHNPLWF